MINKQMNKNKLYTLLFLILGLLSACGEDRNMDNMLSSYADGMGGLNLKNNTSTHITIPVITKSADFTDIEAANFYVGILDASGKEVKKFDTFTELLEEGQPLVLPYGTYTVISSSFEKGDTKVSKNPYFFDKQEKIVIEEKKTTNVTLNCKFKSIGVELVLSEQFKKKLEEKPNDYEYKIVVSNGIAEWAFTPDKMEPGYFLDACDELVTTVSVRLGSDKWYPDRIHRIKNNGMSPQLGEYYIIRLDAGEQEEKVILKTLAVTDKIEE